MVNKPVYEVNKLRDDDQLSLGKGELHVTTSFGRDNHSWLILYLGGMQVLAIDSQVAVTARTG